MVSFEDAVGQAARGVICFVGTSADDLYNRLGGLAGPGGEVGQNLARQLQQRYCGTPPPPPLPPPFIGGQCDGILYDVEAQGINFFGEPGVKTWVGIPGPIEGLVFPEASLPPPRADIRLSYAGGQTSGGSGPSSTNFEDVGSWSITSVVRVDGQPDDCGNPPLPPPTDEPYPPSTVNITYNDYADNSVNIDVDLTFSPAYVDVDGSVNVPVTVNVSPDISFSGDLNLTGNVNFGFGAGGLRPDQEAEPTTEEPEGEQTRCIVAVYVQLSPGSEAAATELFRNGSDELYVPRIGQLFFLSGLGGQPYRSQGFDLKKTENIIVAPQGLCWRAFEVAVEPGVTLSGVAPVYKTQPAS